MQLLVQVVCKEIWDFCSRMLYDTNTHVEHEFYIQRHGSFSCQMVGL